MNYLKIYDIIKEIYFFGNNLRSFIFAQYFLRASPKLTDSPQF